MSNKVIYGNTACPSCRSLGRDKTGDHLVLFKNDEGEQWGKCGRCGHYEVFEKGHVPPVREKKELTDWPIVTGKQIGRAHV